MTAILRAARGGLGGRRLQAVIIGLVALIATAAATLALGMLVDAHSPFDTAFARQHGAQVAAEVDPSVATPAQISAATRLPGVTAVAGPFTTVSVTAQMTVPGVSGRNSVPLRIVGRASPGGPVDDLSLESGHWPHNDRQIVVSPTAPGDTGTTFTIGSHRLAVVGVADSITNTADAWVLPSEAAKLAIVSGPADAQLLYRFGRSATITADIAMLRAALPHAALLNTVSYLSVRQSEQSHIAPWVPFIIAFGVIALLISLFIVINVVSGAVIAGITRIGVLKSIGFTPAQVVGCYVLLVAVPSLLGCLAGAVCGNLLASPLLRHNADIYQVGTLGIPYWVDVSVPLTVLALTAFAAVPPALRAGRMSAIQAIATGRAPRAAHGYAVHRVLARFTRAPRPVTLGLAAPAARPARTVMTVAAVLFGAATVTFGVGLASSLDRAFADASQTSALPIRVMINAAGPAPGNGATKQGPSAITAAQQRTITTALGAQSGTQHYLSEAYDQLNLPGLSNPVSVTAYGGDPRWSGSALISGRWYSGSAREVVVNTLFLTDTNTSVGSTYTLTSGGHRAAVKIVGEVFRPGNDLDMYLSPATLTAVDPGVGTEEYDVALKPGTDAYAYADALSQSLGNAYWVQVNAADNSRRLAVVTMAATLTVLVVIVAALGVLNTIVLQIRERAHDIGVFKAIGMTPRQTVTMVVCSVGLVGLAAGILAVPAGMYLHDGVLPAMAHAANSGVPPSVLSVYTTPEIVLLALAGLGIAVAGALGPAGWAARSRTAFRLRAE